MSSLTTSLLHTDSDLDRIRAFLREHPRKIDLNVFEENMGMESIRANMRLWEKESRLIAFAYVDRYNNLHFEIHPAHPSRELENAVMDWGVACVKTRNAETESQATLDFFCNATETDRIAFLERFGFQRESVRSLKYSRSLEEPLEIFPLPQGYSIRSTTGENEVDALVALHRAAFGTNNMTIEERLSIMRAPAYLPELDLVIVAPDGSLCAFCVCWLEESDATVGNTDPIGVHPTHQKLGLGKAIVSQGIQMLRSRGATTAQLGTSSENIRMQKLAERLGFICVAEQIWFSKAV